MLPDGLCYFSGGIQMTLIRQNKPGLRMLAAGSVLMLFLGIVYVWSVFVAPVSREYAWNAESVKLTSSFMLGFFVVGILAGGKLLPKIGARKVVLSGGILIAAGMLLTALLPVSLAPLLYVTYGIFGGFGVGNAYNAIITSAQKWFPANRGFATGVSIFAFGFSTVVFAPLIEVLINQFGVRYTFMLLAIIFLGAVLLLFNFIRLPDESASANNPSAALPAMKQYTAGEAIKTKEFYFITLSLMLGTSAFFILNPAFKSLAAERSLAESVGTVIVMLTGIANAFGRLGVPLLSDKIGREKAAITIMLATAACALLLIFAQSFLFVAAIVIIAFSFGGYSGLYPVITADYFGIKNVGATYGAVMVGFALSALTFPALIGLIRDGTARFTVLGIMAASAALLVILLLRKKNKGGNYA
jgi:OFA family oxalate/formate antiporter-like MFS transporter